MSPAWRPVGCVEQSRLRGARLQAHHAVQWLAQAVRAFVPAHPDDGHTSLVWEDALDGLVTHPLKGDLRLALRIAELTLLLGHAGGQQSFPLDGRSGVDARRWLGEKFGAHGLDGRGLDAKLPYEIPAHAVGRGAAYDAGAADALAELAAWFANAHGSLGVVRDRMLGRGLAASPVRCWPHHFDMATLTLLEAGGAEHARSVNTGLSPGDEHYDEPYFYVSPHPYPDPAKLPPLPGLGHWHVRGFMAAIAPASRIVRSKDHQTAAEAFLDAAVAAAVKALS